jgi:hypothetical protein
MALKIDPLRIPVFVSCPSALRKDQEDSAQIILDHLEKNKLQWRALGRPDYPRDLPLREVIRMIKKCAGGVVLGFQQFEANNVIYRKGVKGSSKILKGKTWFPTPWNDIEAGILFALNLPVLVFRESNIQTGIFDDRVRNDYTHPMPTTKMSKIAKEELDSLIQRWAGEVKTLYYE